MTKIVHLADLHVGYSYLNLNNSEGQNQREADVERSLIAVSEHIRDIIKPDLIVVAGDGLDSTRISNRGFAGAQRAFKILEEASPVYVIPGNHDDPEAEKSFPMLRLLESERTHIYFHQETKDLDELGVRLHLVPFRVLSRGLRGKEVSEFDFAPDKSNILISHGAVDASGIFEEKVMIPKLWIEEPRFDLCLLGHIHQHRKLNERSFYSGAIERLGFGELKETPGFWVHEIQKGKKPISTSVEVASLGIAGIPRPMTEEAIDCRGKTLEQVDKIAKETMKSQTPGTLMKLRLVEVPVAFQRERMRQDWEEGFKRDGGFHLNVVAETNKVKEYMSDPFEYGVIPTDVSEAFLDYLYEVEMEDDERKALEEMASDILAAAKDKLVKEGEK